MSTNPNTVKSQDDTTEDELGRTMTLLKAIEQLEKTECELERVEKQLDIAVHVLEKYANRDFEEYKPYIWDRGNAARKALICIKVEELKK